MFIYKFRVLLEDQDDFLRDIEIGSKQTFGDFHKALLLAVNLDVKGSASFFVCDSMWKKLKEISKEINEKMPEPVAIKEGEDSRKPVISVLAMDEVRIKDMIDDPHQRLIYEYNHLNLRSFFIELLKIYESNPGVEYPVCVKQQGQLTTAAVPLIFEPEEVEAVDEQAMLEELNEMVDDGQLDTESTDEATPADLPW